MMAVSSLTAVLTQLCAIAAIVAPVASFSPRAVKLPWNALKVQAQPQSVRVPCGDTRRPSLGSPQWLAVPGGRGVGHSCENECGLPSYPKMPASVHPRDLAIEAVRLLWVFVFPPDHKALQRGTTPAQFVAADDIGRVGLRRCVRFGRGSLHARRPAAREATVQVRMREQK